jgi:hypothetical protein
MKQSQLSYFGFSIGTHAQNNSVEKNRFSAFKLESLEYSTTKVKLSNSIALRSEIGIEHDFTVGDHYDNAVYFSTRTTVEPRYITI